MNTARKGFWKRAFPVLLGAFLATAVLAGFCIYKVVSEVGPAALISSLSNSESVSTLRLKEQPVYRVKKTQDLLGMRVMRIISSKQPQEFLVLDGISSQLVDKMFAKTPDLGWANLMANQLLKLREASEDGQPPVSVEIQELKTLSHGTIRHDNRDLPFWHVEVRFKLSNESFPRYYQAGILRSGMESGDSQKDTLIVGYAQKEAFQKRLMDDLLDQLAFQPN